MRTLSPKGLFRAPARPVAPRREARGLPGPGPAPAPGRPCFKKEEVS